MMHNGKKIPAELSPLAVAFRFLFARIGGSMAMGKRRKRIRLLRSVKIPP